MIIIINQAPSRPSRDFGPIFYEAKSHRALLGLWLREKK